LTGTRTRLSHRIRCGSGIRLAHRLAAPACGSRMRPKRSMPVMPVMHAMSSDNPPSRAAARESRAVLYAEAYLWFIFLSALDVMFTAVILQMGGREVNVLANWVLERWDLPGMVGYKFSLVALVVVVCETVGRASWSKGRWLSVVAVAITSVPVILSFVQLVDVVLSAGH